MQKAQICMLSAGLSFGLATGLLVAPKSGKKTRTRIRRAAIAAAISVRKLSQAMGLSAVAVVKESKAPIIRIKIGLVEAIRRSTRESRHAVGLY